MSEPAEHVEVGTRIALRVPVIPSSVHMFCVATSYELGLHNLLAGFNHHGFAYTTLAFGEKWGGWRYRMTVYRDAARAHALAHGPTSLAAMIDAYDALCVRGAEGLIETFRSFGKPILIGLEMGCKILGNGICGHLDAYWMATLGRIPEHPNRFANGGFVMGEAHALAEMFDWMLNEGHSDDQIGIADFACKHPSIVAADQTSRIILNEYWAEGHSGFPKHGGHSWFVHMPGLKNTPHLFQYAKVVRDHVGPFGIAVTDKSNSNPRPLLYFLLFVVLLIILIAFSSGFAAGRHRTLRSKRTV